MKRPTGTHVNPWFTTILVCVLIAGCAISPTVHTRVVAVDDPNLPAPDMTLNIAGLGPCNDGADRSLRLNSRHLVTVLVHGCFGSAGRFRTLSEVLAFHGQLADAVEALSARLVSPQIAVIGHSQGGLVARKALVSERVDPIESHAQLKLVTISAPLSGIRAARSCGVPALRIATLGIHDLLCWMISGDKWYEITAASDFIQKPGALDASVEHYLLVATDEEGSCRRYDDSGRCSKDDFVFTLDEQELPPVHVGTTAREVEVRAGHVEIVGESGVTPVKLIKILQQEGYLRPTEPSRAVQFSALLARLYGADPPNLTQSAQ
jgi:hypothetical protein